ncbi:hypothetical protein LVD17_24560 [Fulvivirga ulvae]|uniref:hypothetical protein n=1 Tax=Fulvivirga ulvae TaxID=2904245 RepID=UPI001F384C11|nr:hypothetical protein [Fulvivirga ulvae]UII31469.1 hypothetical protein LVD17_24560 [Fulvivirga ulvae]
MDTTTTIIGVCLLLLSVAPIAWAGHKSRQKELGLKRSFDRFVSNNNLKLTQWESINGKLIGIDTTNHKLVFVSAKIPEGIIIDLNKRNGFEILRNRKECQLDIRTSVPDSPDDLSIPFFDSEKDDILRFDYFNQKAEQWLALIRQTK